ncbi:MAG TPA: DUF3800 domain-containing protein [Candidatus Glassbacteria bacterium]|nr:DUF3800 domain-containing protein [Candidatus Glassbacteria bacterium]
MEYIIFTDESYITDSRFQSISAFSFPISHYDEIVDSINSHLQSSDVKEFKWQKLKDAKYYFCAEKFINMILDKVAVYQLRVDTIVWDTHDSRHKVANRNDMANYERMFFHLLKNALKKRPRNSSWYIRPDERNGIDWSTIHDCLKSVGKKQEFQSTIFGDFFLDPHYHIRSFQESSSHQEVPIQICDLFTGLSVFSRDSFDVYSNWIRTFSPSLFDEETEKLSNRESFRCKLLSHFNQRCKTKKLGVSLETNRCLQTFKPENPINFWHYQPQGDYDKAPNGR